MIEILNNIGLTLAYLYADWSSVSIDLFFGALAMVTMALLNGNSPTNMRRLLIATFGFVTYLVTRATMLRYQASGEFSYFAAVLGYMGFIIFCIASYLSIALKRIIKFPGGAGGWMWTQVFRFGDWVSRSARHAYYNVLDDSEKLLLYGTNPPDKDGRPVSKKVVQEAEASPS